METVLPVVRHALTPRSEAGLDVVGIGDPLLGVEPDPLVVFGARVLRRLGERQVRPRRHEWPREQLVLERLEAGEVGTEREDPEVGLVAQRDEAQRLVLAVGRERVDRVQYPLRAARLGIDPGPIDVEEQVQHAPAGRRLHTIHGRIRRRIHGRSG
jgi:hypothetical protein